MKKNLVFKLGLFCAALVLIATCFVSSAWAKYTQTVTASDSARVAKFVFQVEEKDASVPANRTQTIALFDTVFTNIKGANNQVSGEKLLAPGSTGSFVLDISWEGSEVSLDIDFSAAVTNTANIPVEWSLDGVNYSGNLNDLLATKHVEWFVNGTGADDADTSSFTIHWRWQYSVDADKDQFDTNLGYNGEHEISVVISVVATQKTVA